MAWPWQKWWHPTAHAAPPALPWHLRAGQIGEAAAREFLERRGLRTLALNYRTAHGELDLVMRDGDCMVFIEVKTRSGEAWGRPADAVDMPKRRRLSRSALAYLRRIGNPHIPIRFDVVEVVLEGAGVAELRHLCNCFPLSAPYRYG